MNQSVRDCLVDGYQPWIPNLILPDPNDRHVLTTAIQAGAQAIITIIFEQASALKNPPRTIEDLVGTLESCGMVQSMNRVRGLLT